MTFLFTDIEGSTRRWESDAEAMRSALAAHDAVLRSAIESHGGWMFKHTGDGVCAAFSDASAAVAAAVAAQRALELPVRMGLGTGSAEQRGDDYFGPALNRAARVMAVGHGGQILVAGSTAALIDRVDEFTLDDLGEHRLRDLSGLHRLFQVRADGLRDDFPPVKTLDAIHGNLPVLSTSFVGRQAAMAEVMDLVRRHRLVTLTGVGGVGKTRLAVQVAAEMAPEFGDGVWLVELASVGDPDAVPDAVATALGVVAQPEVSMVDAIARALSGRRVLVVIDNCEHVLDATAEVVEAILARAPTVAVIATSREGLRVGAERLWPVPSLDVGDGEGSEAVELFLDRARASTPGYAPHDQAELDTIREICARVDGIALAIELAAARMTSMSPTEIRDRLGDRFRLLAGGRRGLERHQTLRHAVAWSYDLLDDQEREVLRRCAVFAGGFDVAAAVAVVGGEWDDYMMLDALGSLVRKSLVTATRGATATRYGMLETIRQFAEERLVEADAITDAGDRHARYFADQAVAWWGMVDGPDQMAAIDAAEIELANFRASFHWAVSRDDLVTATAIAAHSTWLCNMRQLFEPITWAEEILPKATAAQVPQLPRLYCAAAGIRVTGRTVEAMAYAEEAVRLETQPGFEPFDPLWSQFLFVNTMLYDNQIERALLFADQMAAAAEPISLVGRIFQLIFLPLVGRTQETVEMADATLADARRHGDPTWTGYAMLAYGGAVARADPASAMAVLREGLDYTSSIRNRVFEGDIAALLASLEAMYGDPIDALDLFDAHLASLHRAGSFFHMTLMFGRLAPFFERLERPEVGATLYGMATTRPTHLAGRFVPTLNTRLADRLRARLGEATFEECVAAGAALELGDAVTYARREVELARRELADQPDGDERQSR